jgi:hypothetical protein
MIISRWIPDRPVRLIRGVRTHACGSGTKKRELVLTKAAMFWVREMSSSEDRRRRFLPPEARMHSSKDRNTTGSNGRSGAAERTFERSTV